MELQTMYEIALDIAKRAHFGQKRDDGEDYINHPLRLVKARDSETLRTLKILHDVVEDHPKYIEELKRFLPKAVYEMLMLLTRKKGENYFEFIMRIKNSRNNIVIEAKLEDLADNMKTSKEGSRLDKYRFAEYILNREWRDIILKSNK